MSKIKDTEYLYISTRLKVLERYMLTRDKYLRMASAKSDADALKILAENGWVGIDEDNRDSLEEAIALKRREILDLLYKYCPDSRVIDIFRIKYDYHNIKVYLKSKALDTDASELYSDAGTLPVSELKKALGEKKGEGLSEIMFESAAEAEDVLLRTRDPQLSDVLLDTAHIKQMLLMAQAVESEFLVGYVQRYIDLCNIRVAARAARAGKGCDYLKKAICAGGLVGIDGIIAENSAETLEKAFGRTEYSAVVQAAIDAMNASGSMARLDMLCDNHLLAYLNSARLIPYGEAQVISYLLKMENQLVSVRTVMTCRGAGIREEQIMERLRLDDV